MTREIIFPADADPDLPESVWAKGCLSTRSFGSAARQELSQAKLDQATAIAKAVIRYDMWAVCLSASPYYMRTLYPHIAAAWMYSRRDTADIMDADDLLKGAFSFDDEEKGLFRTRVLDTGLLILPRIDPTHMGITKVRGVLSTLLMSRKMSGKPVITDIKTSRKPTDAGAVSKELCQLQDVLGESTLQLFRGERTKSFIVKTV